MVKAVGQGARIRQDFACVPVDDAMSDGLWCGRNRWLRVGLGLVPEAISGRRGDHQHNEGQMAVHASGRAFWEPTGERKELLAVAKESVLNPTAVVIQVHDGP